MTIEEKISVLKQVKEALLASNSWLESTKNPVEESFDMAIKTLEQQTCEDCISRQAVLDGLASIAKVKARSDAQKSLMGRIMFFVEQLPSVTPKSKTGKWIYTGDYITDGMLKCSSCGYEHDVADRFLYCPNCGLKMIDPEESEDKE